MKLSLSELSFVRTFIVKVKERKKRSALVAAVDCCVVWIRFEFVGCTGGSYLPSGIRSGSGNQTEPHSNIFQRIKTPKL